MRKLRKFGLIYTLSTILLILTYTFQLLLFINIYSFVLLSIYDHINVIVANLSSVPIFIAIIMFFREKVKMIKVYGGISSLIVIVILILFLISRFEYSFSFSEILSLLIIVSILFFGGSSCYVVLKVFLLKSEDIDMVLVKKTILELSTKFSRLRVIELNEKCKVDDSTVIKVIKNMIKNKEIYADYFKSSQTIAFDQQRNIDEIDELMRVYVEWEKEKIGKDN